MEEQKKVKIKTHISFIQLVFSLDVRFWLSMLDLENHITKAFTSELNFTRQK